MEVSSCRHTHIYINVAYTSNLCLFFSLSEEWEAPRQQLPKLKKNMTIEELTLTIDREYRKKAFNRSKANFDNMYETRLICDKEIFRESREATTRPCLTLPTNTSN
jgi:hypothetical protein